jgi:anti-anti-sigma factor
MKYEIEDLGQYKMIHIIGNIDMEAHTREIDERVSRLMKEGHHDFVFNLERTTFLDSAGISIFINCLCDVQEHEGSIYIIAEESQVRNVLEMVGITRLIKTYNSREEFMQKQKAAVLER